jgi:hypothetical protein
MNSCQYEKRGVTYGKGDEVVEEEARNAEQQDLGEDEGSGEEEDEEGEDGGNRRRQEGIEQGMEEEGQQMEDDERGEGRDEESTGGRGVGLIEDPASDEER